MRPMRIWGVLAVRFLVRHGRRTAITAASIAAAVALLVLLAAIMVGVNDLMVGNSVAMHSGHLMVVSASAQRWDPQRWVQLVRWPPGVACALPRLAVDGVLTGGSHVAAVRLYGVVPQEEKLWTAVPRRLTQGRYVGADNEVVLGERLAARLGLRPGGQVTLRLSEESGGGTLTVVGEFRTGVDRFDELVGHTTLRTVERLAGTRAAPEVSIFLRDGADASDVATEIRGELGSNQLLQQWPELLPDVAQLIELNRIAMFIVMVLALLLVGFGVANTVLLSVSERRREFAMLRALGARPAELLLLVLMETGLLGALAAALGLVLGVLVSWGVAVGGIDFGAWTSYNRYFVLDSVVRPRVDAFSVFVPFAVAVGSGIVAGLLPARMASAGSIAGGLRPE